MMLELQIKEIKLLFDSGALKSAQLVFDFGHWSFSFVTKKGEYVAVKTQRGENKRYKTADAALTDLYEIGFRNNISVEITDHPKNK